MGYDTDETVAIEIIGAIVGSVVKQLGAALEFCIIFFRDCIINEKEYGGIFQERRGTA
jgi:hypothetical protein